MVINVHAGHNPDGKVACGAVGIVKESTEARAIKDSEIAKLRAFGYTVYDCTCENGTSQNNVLQKIVKECNSHNADLDVSVHLNCGRKDNVGDGSTGGVEVHIYRESDITKEYAERICAELAALGFRNRGVKISPHLYVLKRTNAPAMLVECFFCDDKDDVELYRRAGGAEGIAAAIVRGITGQSVQANNANPASQAAPGFPFEGYVAEDGTNIRNAPGMNGAEIGTASKGQKVTVWAIEGEWCKVDNGKYVHRSLVIRAECWQAYLQAHPVQQEAPRPAAPQPVPQTQTPPVPPLQPDIIYAVKLAAGRTLPEVKNDSDYAGNEGQQIVGFKCRLSDGTPIRYRVHTVNGAWLPWVSGCDWNDFKNGYAGNDKNAIDAIEIKCDFREVLYKASSVNNGPSYYGTVSSRTASGNNSYAGTFGKPVDKIMCWL